MSTPTPSLAPPRGRATSRQYRRSARSQAIAAYVLLAPSLLFFLLFLIVPTLFAIVLSLSQWGGFDLSQITFVGVRNYVEIFRPGSDFLVPILTNTLWFAFGSVVLVMVCSVAIASFLERLRFQGFWRTLYFLPVVTTVVAIGNVWRFLYQPAGFINKMLNAVGISSQPFLSDPTTALPSVVVVAAWAATGSAVLILVGGLKSVPAEFYEAAELDGANSWQRFRHVTLPLLRPTLLFVLVTQTITGLQSFAIVNVMTGNGGPANSTNVAALEMYLQAFSFGQWGIASAMAMVLFAIILVFTLGQLWLFRRQGEEI